MKEIKVLFLDDEQKVLNSIARIFADEPYGVAVASSSAEAMEIIAREKIKVVLSDQRMPDISGVEFLHMIKLQISGHCPHPFYGVCRFFRRRESHQYQRSLPFYQ